MGESPTWESGTGTQVACHRLGVASIQHCELGACPPFAGAAGFDPLGGALGQLRGGL